jgi:hypothetical protein
MLVVGLLLVATVESVSTAAAAPVYSVDVHARLAPVVGTKATGRFGGTLRITFGGPVRPEPSGDTPSPGSARLIWKLSLPALRGTMSASLRLRASQNAAPVARTLCTSCSVAATGTLNLTVAQGLRVTSSGAVIVVRTASARLRGPVRVSPQLPLPQ